jgi:hypothetical protein
MDLKRSLTLSGNIYWLDRHRFEQAFFYHQQFSIAEVVGGSNPTLSISFILGKYGIELNSILTIVGQNPQQCHYQMSDEKGWIKEL